MNHYKTQKAQGLEALRTWCINRGIRLVPPFATLRAQQDDDAREREIANALDYVCGFPLFARPCPTRPRHGFVDSRVVEDRAQLDAVMAATFALEPEGEIILMKPIDAPASAILTPSSVVIGVGNDGATTGTGPQRVFTLGSVFPDYITDAARIAPGEVPYMEAVYCRRNGEPALVQVRSGPATGGDPSRDYVPASQLAQYVVKADGDLVEWEAKVKNFPPQTVVWHPGGSRLSHYAAHVMARRDLAIVFSAECPTRKWLDASKEDALPEYDRTALALGIARGLSVDLNAVERQSLLNVMAVGVQNAANLRTGESAELFGGCAAILLRMLAAACVGEYRHKRNSPDSGRCRDNVYKRVLTEYRMRDRALLRSAWQSFADSQWTSGYGGRPWATAAAKAVDLEAALFGVLRGDVEPERLVSAAHRALNAAHNNGTLLDKFGSTHALDFAANGDPILALRAMWIWLALPGVSHAELVGTMRRAFTEQVVTNKAAQFWDSERGEWRALASMGKKKSQPKFEAQARCDYDGSIRIQYRMKAPAGTPRNVYGKGSGARTYASTVARGAEGLDDVRYAATRSAYNACKRLRRSYSGSTLKYVPISATLDGTDLILTAGSVPLAVVNVTEQLNEGEE